MFETTNQMSKLLICSFTDVSVHHRGTRSAQLAFVAHTLRAAPAAALGNMISQRHSSLRSLQLRKVQLDSATPSTDWVEKSRRWRQALQLIPGIVSRLVHPSPSHNWINPTYPTEKKQSELTYSGFVDSSPPSRVSILIQLRASSASSETIKGNHRARLQTRFCIYMMSICKFLF